MQSYPTPLNTTSRIRTPWNTTPCNPTSNTTRGNTAPGNTAPDGTARYQLADASDALLAERAADSDTFAFEILARRYSPRMRAYARRLTGSLSDADDVVQEALVQAWARMDELRDPAALKSWLMRITAHTAFSELRRRKGHADVDDLPGAADPAPSPESAAITNSGITALSGALAALPPGQRQCWVLKEVGGHTYEEIAQALDISTESVRGRLARARTTLIKEMEAWR